jgi:hypothetical protein
VASMRARMSVRLAVWGMSFMGGSLKEAGGLGEWPHSPNFCLRFAAS